MSTDTATITRTKIVVSPVDHYTGSRHTRRTWTAAVVLSNGTEARCGHEQHRTTDAAARCGRQVWDRTEAEGVA